MNDEIEQLRRYAESQSEDAFAAVVHRYLPLVYAAALRRVGGGVQQAQDVTQLVFIALARNASALAQHPDLTGWLFTTTRFLAAKALRSERRRWAREQQASMTNPEIFGQPDDGSPSRLGAVVDDVLAELAQVDRQVILLRFHQGMRLAEIGARLGATENAVQKRVERALEKLRDKLSRRGITSTATALVLALEHQSAVAVPAGLAATAAGAGITCAAGAASILGISNFMIMSKLQIGLVATVVAAVSAGYVWEHRENSVLRADLARQNVAASTSAAELRRQVDAQTRRATAAEADVDALLTATRTASAVQAASATGSNRLVATMDVANSAITRSQQLIRAGKQQEGLDELLKAYRELQAKQPGSVECQRLMSSIKSLGQSYPPATSALRDLRDAAMQQFETTRNIRHPRGSLAENQAPRYESEIALLNERLGEGRQTMVLYDSLAPDDERHRQALGMIAHTSFVEAQRYSDAMFGKSFGSMLNELDMGIRMSTQVSGPSQLTRRDSLTKATALNIEVLTGAGKLEEARTLRQKLLVYNDSDATRALIKQHVDRASQQPVR